VNDASISLNDQPRSSPVYHALNVVSIAEAIQSESEIVEETLAAAETRVESQALRVWDSHFAFAAPDVQPRIALDTNGLKLAVRSVRLQIELSLKSSDRRLAPVHPDLNLTRQIIRRDWSPVSINPDSARESLRLDFASVGAQIQVQIARRADFVMNIG
jgi:hypothetical protein